jgi:DNA repair exonuclease SbcCD nuclease subunit
MARFIHTADFQIGKPYNWANGRAQRTLKERRERAIEQMGEVAAERNADFIVVAGDFFDANTIEDDVITRACRRLSSVDVPVYILPGNHDFAAGPASVYERSTFERHQPGHVTVLDSDEPQAVGDGEAVLLPAPIRRRNELGDPTSHFGSDLGREEAPDAIRVGVAHGGVVDFEGGEASSRIDPERVEAAELDYLALGDWHGKKEVRDRVWYSGTPEPDSFKQNGPGYVLDVEIEEPGADPVVEPVETAQTRWIRKKIDIRHEDDLAAFQDWFEDLDDPLNALVRLELRGQLGLEATSALEDLLDDLENTVLHLRRRGNGVRPKASLDEIDTIATDGYVRTAVERLKAEAESGEESAEKALQLLYQLKRE